MAASNDTLGIRRLARGLVVLGGKENFWTWTEDRGYDLTHPTIVESLPISNAFRFPCETTHVTVDPAKTALVLVDMQNLFLCKALGKRSERCQQAEHSVLTKAIPAARKVKIRIVWLTWGLTQADLDNMTPSMLRAWGFKSDAEIPSSCGIGAEMEPIQLEDGKMIHPGRRLFIDQWNSELHGGLKRAYDEGQSLDKPDVRFYKNRNSGMCPVMTKCTDFFKKTGIRTLLFAGVDTDQSVLATLTDASQQGFDCILLKDGCATTSPMNAQRLTEYYCNSSWGFVSSCESLLKASQYV